jgi:putative aldouronate transport system substrate-binding protein
MKRLLFVLVAMLSVAMVFAAGEQEGTAGTADGGVQLTQPGTFPIVQEMVELTYMIPSNQNVADYEDNHLTSLLEERTNVRINLRLTPNQDYNNKMNLLFASQSDLPDMIFPNGMDVNAQLMWGDQGVLMPLNDLIEEQAILFQKMLEEQPQVEPLVTAADGNIYSFPSVSFCPHCDPASRYWINQDWLDNLGLEKPSTTEEFRQVLDAFRTQDPNGNGQSDEIPLIGARTGWHAAPQEFLLNSFLNWNESQGEMMYVDDGTVVAAYTQPEYRDGLAYMNQLVQEGLLDPASFTQDFNQLKQLILSDTMVVGVFPAGGTAHYNSDHTARAYVHLDPLVGPDGVQNAMYNPWAGIGNGKGSITSVCEYPEVAVRWFDQFYDFETGVTSRYGRKGVDWRYLDEGEVALNSAKQQTPAKMLREVWGVQQPHNIHWYLKHPYYMYISIETADWEAFDRIAAMGDSTMRLKEYTLPPDTQMPPVSLLPDEVQEYNELKATIDTYVEESMVRFIVGDLNIRNDWDAYIASLDSLGLERYVEMKQEAYNRVWK